MKNIFIKYNPYKLETIIKIDGKNLPLNSMLGEYAFDGTRLQEWIEEMPSILVDEYNDTDFQIEFNGTLLDYEDLALVFADAKDKGILNHVTIKRIPAKETIDKEVLIDEVFEEIQKGPFEELRDEEITTAFEHAKSGDFEVCVVATMSSGKSTLINAMLGTKLMPSQQEACTAIITRIKDITDYGETNIPFEAEVYDKEGELIKTFKDLNYDNMKQLNADENVSIIKIDGDIPFVTNEDVSLVLIDTPGPNNSRDPRHKKVQSEYLSQSSKALILYIMTGEFGTDDDNSLLRRVAESMEVGGKQSKDRFIFVVNKLDNRKKEDGDTEETLQRVRNYLETHGIINPNIFPAAALPALLIRQFGSGELDKKEHEDDFEEIEFSVRKFNRNSNKGMHFETYASLPPSIRAEIDNELSKTRSNWKRMGGEEHCNHDEALIHTGIISIEASIRQYVQKYAKTAKVKNIVDTFMHKLEEVGCFEETKREYAENQKEKDRIIELLGTVRRKMDDAKEIKKFKKAVDDAVKQVENKSCDAVEEVIQKFQSKIRKRIDELKGVELDVNDAKDEVDRLKHFATKLEPDIEVALDDLIRQNLVQVGNSLLSEYKNKLASLTNEFKDGDVGAITIDPLKLMGSRVVDGSFSINSFVAEKKVKVGEKYVENTNKKWWKPWTWFEESGYYRSIYETVKYVKMKELADNFFTGPIKQIEGNGKAALKYAKEQSKNISEWFNAESVRLDKILKDKLLELESYATDRDKAEERIKESKQKLEWLEKIKIKVESILEI